MDDHLETAEYSGYEVEHVRRLARQATPGHSRRHFGIGAILPLDMRALLV